VREADEAAGFGACSGWMIDSDDPSENCLCSEFNDPVLRVGCENFLSLQWDNADVEYEQVTCPDELNRLNCWEENGNDYPDDIPEFCASNVDGSESTSTPVSESTSTPVSESTSTPVATPVVAPSATPVAGPECEDSPRKFLLNGKVRTCAYVAKKPDPRCFKNRVDSHCPNTCGTCSTCVDSTKKWKRNGKNKRCTWVSKKSSKRCTQSGVPETCRNTCQVCEE